MAYKKAANNYPDPKKCNKKVIHKQNMKKRNGFVKIKVNSDTK